jgi:hypothetical protein
MSLDLVIRIILARIINYETPHYELFHSLLLLPSSLIEIISSAPFSKISSVYAFSLMGEARFHNSEKQIKI